MEAVQKKEAMLKAKLDPWLEEAYQVSTTIQGKMMAAHTVEDQASRQRMSYRAVGSTSEAGSHVERD